MSLNKDIQMRRALLRGMEIAADIFIADLEGEGHKSISEFADAIELLWGIKCPISGNNHTRTFESEI